MRKFLVFSLLVVLTTSLYAQPLNKGNLLGIHLVTMNLNAGVSMEQAMDFMLTKYIPAYEANFPGVKVYLAKAIRGVNAGRIYQIVVMDSDETRNKYFKAEGTYSDLANAALEKMKAVLDEAAKMGTFNSEYSDCIIQ